jgi:arabinose-5-phosphate isomerase
MSNNIINTAKRTILSESQSIAKLENFIDQDFENTVKKIYQSKGRIVISGIGKSAIVAQKIVSSLNSTGTPSIFLHAADAIHGDIGMVQQEDIVVIISKSGDSPEIKVLVPLIKNFRNTLIAICGNMQSYLAKCADIVLNTTVESEASPYNLAPTSSTTAQLVMGDAICVCLMELRGFGSEDFAKFHPGGTLGKKLYLHVGDLSVNNEKPAVNTESLLKDVIIEITKRRLGVTVVLDNNEKIIGIITDGDLRRMLEKDLYHKGVKAKDIMTLNPKTIDKKSLAVNALDIMRDKNITQLIVTENNSYSGIIHLHDLVREGII